MATTSYKCLSCGAGIGYNPDLGKFKCEYCQSEFTESELTKGLNKDREALDQSNLKSYHCNSCGADVVTNETTSATFCYYCHNPVILTGRLSGDFTPSKIIPFEIGKQKAQEMFLNWAEKHTYVPKNFTSTSQLDKITGMYLPHWRVDANARIDLLAQAEQVKRWQSGGTEYTETNVFEVERKGNLEINNVGDLGFDKIDKNLINGISPYDEAKAIPFSMGYLSGFYAEQYNIPVEKIEPKVKNDLDRYFNTMVDEMTNEYSKVNPQRREVNINIKDWSFTLLPAWILTYNYQGKTYIYAINGQTGKFFGELPFAKGKAFINSGLVAAIVLALLLLGGRLIW